LDTRRPSDATDNRSPVIRGVERTSDAFSYIPLSLSLSRLLLSFLFLLLFKSQLRVTVGVRLDSPPQESRASLHLGISSSQLPFFFPFFPSVLLLLLLLLYVHKLQFHLYFRFFFPKRNPCRLRAEVSGNLYGVEFPLTYIQLLFVPVKVQIDFLFLKRILFFFCGNILKPTTPRTSTTEKIWVLSKL
jgi:hypothetical protein